MEKLIGKIQLIIGVILLIGGLIGLIISYNYYKENLDQYNSDLISGANEVKESQFSNETRYLWTFDLVQIYEGEYQYINICLICLISSFSIAIIMSILFITQGLVNMSRKENK